MARWLFALALCVAGAGCNRHDADALSRIGRKVAVHAKNSAGDVGAKVDLSWAGGKRELSLHDKVQDRLRFENTLSEASFEVIVKEKEVELKGTVKTPSQKQRATELAETVAGVERVVDLIVVKED